MIGAAFSIYEMTMHFKVHTMDKIRIMCKTESGGLKADNICQKGYI